jgi:intracellular multiplication protein IcmQ
MTVKTSVSLAQAQAIQEALHSLANSPSFTHSSFLKIVQQQIQQLSQGFDEAVQSVYFSEDSSLIDSLQNQDQQIVYISVYCSDGSKIDAWSRVIMNLPKQYISRPVYLREEDAQKAAKAKAQFLNEAYVAVMVDKKNIFSTDNELFNLKDKFGHRLITLKDRAIDLSNILFFWHHSKQYILKNNSLIFSQSLPDFLQED